VNSSDVIDGAFYWVWIDPSDRHRPGLPPILIVAQPWRHPGSLRLNWEGCGTDEGIRVLQIVSRIDPPKIKGPSA
jgi:hypothetical protein